ncbi:unnamed protein product [Rhizophagus irregularis]|nr:unnamed protein product [Rhizophagus irregularis]
MANPNILNVNINNVLSNWPFNATRALIRIARRISNNYNFIVTQNQCRNKWQALKRGYENLSRINNGNPDGHPIHSPNNYNIRFFNELSDEFWLQTNRLRRAYLQLRVDRRTYRYRERRGVVPEAVAAAAVAAAAAAATTAIRGGEEEIEEEEIGIKVNTN